MVVSERVFVVASVEQYGNQALCAWFIHEMKS